MGTERRVECVLTFTDGTWHGTILEIIRKEASLVGERSQPRLLKRSLQSCVRLSRNDDLPGGRPTVSSLMSSTVCMCEHSTNPSHLCRDQGLSV